MRNKLLYASLVAVLLVVAGLSLPAAAQSGAESVVQSLDHPRDLAYAADGTLYIAEGGHGGEVMMDTPEGEQGFGSTGRIGMVAPDGTYSVVLSNLPSVGDSGPSGVAVTDTSLWLALSAGPPNALLSFSLVEVDRASLRVKRYVDLLSNEIVNNPDGNEIDSNPVDVEVAADGTVYVVDAGCNCILTWTEADGLQVFHAWEDNPVPTALAFDPDGNLVVGFLSPAPFTPGSAGIEVWSPAGELVTSYDGLTMVVGVAVSADGTIYATELAAEGFGEQGPTPGAVVSVGMDGITPVLEGLSAPYGLAFNPDGALVVGTNASFGPPMMGEVLVVPMEM